MSFGYRQRVLAVAIIAAFVAAQVVVQLRSLVPASAATTAPSLVIARDFPDPDILRVGSTYYAYSTNSGPNLPVATATALKGPWTVHGHDALPALGAWARGGFTWAPDVSVRADGRFLLYYTARSRVIERQCIGAALADSPLGPFVPVGTEPLVCDAGDAGDIDASTFVDTDGRRYLLYKNDGNSIGGTTSIWLQRVADDGLTFIGGRVGLIRNDRPEEGGVVEAPTLVKRGGMYVLLYSAAGFGGSAYFTGYATSSTVDGPYTKAASPLLTTAAFGGVVQGPGGQDVVSTPTGDHLVFHGWINGFRARGMYGAELAWAGAAPVVRGARHRYEAEHGSLTRCTVRTGVRGASGGAVAAYIDYSDSSVDQYVFAPRVGRYSLYVGYAAGFGDATHVLTVNSGSETVVHYPARGWDNWSEVEVGVTLRQGWNHVRLRHGTAWAELDYMDVA